MLFRSHEVGLNVLRSPDAEETTRISFFPKGHPRFGTAQLQIDGVNSSIREDLIPRPAEVGPLDVGDDENNLQVVEVAGIIQRAVPGCELKYLADNPELDKEGLIKDRKVKEGGGDTRTYKVSFEKIKNTFPEFHCEWNVKRGVEDMVAQLTSLPLSNEKFKSRGFYRLQQLEYLHENGYLSDDLFWLKSQVAI